MLLPVDLKTQFKLPFEEVFEDMGVAGLPDMLISDNRLEIVSGLENHHALERKHYC
jgi:hypothetical protein